jgi:hypothetical protein
MAVAAFTRGADQFVEFGLGEVLAFVAPHCPRPSVDFPQIALWRSSVPVPLTIDKSARGDRDFLHNTLNVESLGAQSRG